MAAYLAACLLAEEAAAAFPRFFGLERVGEAFFEVGDRMEAFVTFSSSIASVMR